MPGGWRKRKKGARGDTRQTPSNGTHVPPEPQISRHRPSASRPRPSATAVACSLQPPSCVAACVSWKEGLLQSNPTCSCAPEARGSKPLMCWVGGGVILGPRPEMLVPDSQPRPSSLHFEQGAAGGLWCFGAPAIQEVPEPAQQQHRKPQRRPSSSRPLSAGPEPARHPTPTGLCAQEGQTVHLS